jgi:hypothetical protein
MVLLAVEPQQPPEEAEKYRDAINHRYIAASYQRPIQTHKLKQF